VSLAAGLAIVYRPEVRRMPVLLVVAAVLGLAAAAAPDVAPLFAQAALPGAALALGAWALRLVSDPQRTGSRLIPQVAVSASSLTRPLAARPSLIVASALDDSPTTTQARSP
jgi:hypothetical protein